MVHKLTVHPRWQTFPGPDEVAGRVNVFTNGSAGPFVAQRYSNIMWVHSALPRPALRATKSVPLCEKKSKRRRDRLVTDAEPAFVQGLRAGTTWFLVLSAVVRVRLFQGALV